MATERCLCSRCVPAEGFLPCSRCGAEVRWGARSVGQAPSFLHRDEVDHIAAVGHSMTHAEEAALEAELDVVRERQAPTKDGFPLLFEIETYTTREHDILKDTDATRRKRRLAKARGLDPDAPPPPPPPPEVARHDVNPADFPPRSGIRQIYNLLEKTDGWEVRRFTGARGPYMGSDGSVLSISDSVVLGARGPRLDLGVAVAVASWRDGKFDSAYAGRLHGGAFMVGPVNATELKRWIKEPK